MATSGGAPETSAVPHCRGGAAADLPSPLPESRHALRVRSVPPRLHTLADGVALRVGTSAHGLILPVEVVPTSSAM